MKIELEKEKNNVVKMNIEFPAKDAVEAYNRASMRISQHINIPGFRRGKAPRNVVEQHVGAERIKYEALESLLPKVFQQAIKENDLDVISQPTVDSYDFNVGEDLKITAKVEVRPEFELKDYKGMTVDVEEYVIPDDAYEKSLQNMLDRAVTYEVVVDRPAKEDDLVKFDFEGFSNGEKIEHGDGKNYTLDLAHSRFIPGFAEQLVGHNVDEEFEINVNFPEDYHEAKLAGAPATFKIKIHEIKQKVRPELNEEFAKKVGFDSVEALEKDIKDFLQKDKETRDRRSAEIAVFDKILENVEIDVQPSMIEREQQVLLNEYKQRLAQSGFTFEQALQQQGEEEILKSSHEDALKRIKNTLVIDKIAKLENIDMTTDDMQAKVAEMQNSYGLDKTEVMKQLAMNPTMLSAVSQQILSEKVTNFLVENNKMNYVAPKAEKKKSSKKSKDAE
ncbi:trigger factor [bacterium]|nr:trigger factor [bacterium]